MCPTCGAKYPVDSTFCIHCSVTQESDETESEPVSLEKFWEYREIAVPLGVLSTGPLAPLPDERRCQQVVNETIQRVTVEGWELIGPTDWRSMARSRRLRQRREYGRSRLASEYFEEFIVIQIRRPAQTLKALA